MDVTLWREAVSGNKRSFAVVFGRHRAKVFRVARGQLGGTVDADDVVSIVFLEAWKRRAVVRMVDGSLAAWLLAVTRNVTVNYSRAKRRHRALLARIPIAPPEADHSDEIAARLDLGEQMSAVATAVHALPPGDRAVFHLCIVKELPLAEAASRLRVPLGTIKSRLHRVRKRVQAELGDLRNRITHG